MKNSTLTLLLVGVLLAPGLAAAPQGPDLSRAREFIKLARSNPRALRPYSDRLSRSEAAALVSQVAALARPGYPDVDVLVSAIRVLEAHRAMESGQRKLNSLLWVLGLTLALFTVFFIYVLFDQRRSLRQLQALLATASADRTAGPGGNPAEVYRGD